MQIDLNQLQHEFTRRQFFRSSATGIGAVALGSLLNPDLFASETPSVSSSHFPGKAKRVIYLFMHGGPSQMELFDYKPRLKQLNSEPLGAEVVPHRRPQSVSISTAWRERYLGQRCPAALRESHRRCLRDQIDAH